MTGDDPAGGGHTSDDARDGRSGAARAWDAARYDEDQSFVAAHGTPLVDLLDPEPDDRHLDLGCGTGDLTADLAALAARVVGVDRSPAMVRRARRRHDRPAFLQGALRALPVPGGFDGALSNAVLHWVPGEDQDRVLDGVAEALRPGSRFVAELGGTGNVASVVRAVNDRRRAAGQDAVDPWYFPSVGEYASRLERAGFEVRAASLFDRPTTVAGEDGLRSWLTQFGDPLLGDLPDAERASVVDGAVEDLRPDRFDGGEWTLDYRRLRFVAVRK